MLESAEKSSKFEAMTARDKPKRLTFLNKLAFSCCGPPYQLTATSIGFFFGSVFLLEVARLPPIYVSMIVLIGRLWDAVTDPIVGYLVNLTQTRAPSLKRWCLINTPVLAVSYLFLWVVPPFPMLARFFYFLVMYMLFQTALTCLNVPSNVMIMYITKSANDRNSATATKMAVELFSVVLSVLIHQVSVMAMNLSQKDNCQGGAGHQLPPSSTDTPSQGGALFNSSGGTGVVVDVVSDETLGTWKKSYFVAASVITAIIVITMLVFVFGNDETTNYDDETCKKRVRLSSTSAPEELGNSFRGAFMLIVSYKPFQILASAYLFLALSLQLIQTNFVLFLKIVFGLRHTYHYALLILLGSAFLTVPLWHLVLNCISKRKAFALGNIILMVPCVAMFFMPPDIPLWQTCLWCAFAGIGVANAYLLPWSMLPDVIADYHVQMGARHDGLFYGVYVFYTKFAVGIAQGLSQLALHVAGYENEACVQREAVPNTIRFLIAPVPCVLMFVSMFLLCFYKLETSHTPHQSDSDVQNLQDNDKTTVYRGRDAMEPLQQSGSGESLSISRKSSPGAGAFGQDRLLGAAASASDVDMIDTCGRDYSHSSSSEGGEHFRMAVVQHNATMATAQTTNEMFA